ncbi:hypothetical protein E3N88_14899 [Mikania micrantha]|uniref:MADF domain-containing protein n=1 Tax=Mikania micrantha TaxID=192012 RepID=A0A5N6P2V0_9ASTR|nr:hypothetical protein E3N88_14899 [Mikania micrantha]
MDGRTKMIVEKKRGMDLEDGNIEIERITLADEGDDACDAAGANLWKARRNKKHLQGTRRRKSRVEHKHPPTLCRHKMEKLRQRHRVEKQRSAAFSGERFISTWFYYEAMENGSKIEPGSLNLGPGILLKPLTAEKFEALAPKSTKRSFGNFSSIVSNQEAQLFVETPIEEILTLKNHKKNLCCRRDSDQTLNHQDTNVICCWILRLKGFQDMVQLDHLKNPR